jgi:hypothetical protein
MTLEQLDELVEAEQRAGKPVDLIHNDDVDPTSFNVGEKAFEGRAIKRPTVHATIVVTVGNQDPAFPSLAGDIGLAGLSLGVQRVELHLQAFLAGLAGVNRAAQLSGHPMQIGAVCMLVSGMAAVGATAVMFGVGSRHDRPG